MDWFCIGWTALIVNLQKQQWIGIPLTQRGLFNMLELDIFFPETREHSETIWRKIKKSIPRETVRFIHVDHHVSDAALLQLPEQLFRIFGGIGHSDHGALIKYAGIQVP